MHAKPFLVIFTARSGSTALYGNLRSHPDVVMRAEVFGNKELPGGLEQNDDNRVAFLRQYWGAFRPGRAVQADKFRGFKLQFNRNNEQFSAPRRLVKVALEYSPRIVVLRRQNHLKQAISAINAAHTLEESAVILKGRGTAHVTKEEAQLLGELRSKPREIDLARLEVLLKGIERNYQLLDMVAEAFGETYDVTYEDYLSDRDEVVKGIMSYIGMDPDKWVPEDAYVKITSDNLQDAIVNYEALKQFASGTRYENML